MNAQNVDSKPKIRKETKNKIKVDFERTSFKERFKAKYLTFTFVKKIAWVLIRYILLIGIAYVVLFPFFSKISASVMSYEDFNDTMVRLIPKHFSLDIYKAIFVEQHYMKAFGNTLALSLSTALIQTFICSFIAYGFAKFKFKGNKLLFAIVILTMVIPHRTIASAMRGAFLKFDIFGIFGFLSGGGISFFGLEYNNDFLSSINLLGGLSNRFTASGIDLLDTYWPFMILSFCGLAFKNGLYIFLLRQFFMGVPDELEESAYIDGSGVFRTFFTIILPISIPMMITVFLFAFSWQWTDMFYTSTSMFVKNVNTTPYLLTTDIGFKVPGSLQGLGDNAKWEPAVKGTGGLMIIAPLVIMYLFCQKYLVQGIERSGLTAD